MRHEPVDRDTPWMLHQCISGHPTHTLLPNFLLLVFSEMRGNQRTCETPHRQKHKHKIKPRAGAVKDQGYLLRHYAVSQYETISLHFYFSMSSLRCLLQIHRGSESTGLLKRLKRMTPITLHSVDHYPRGSHHLILSDLDCSKRTPDFGLLSNAKYAKYYVHVKHY